jgi:hypothetical protein
LLLGSLFVVTSSCLCFLGLFRVFGGSGSRLSWSLFLLICWLFAQLYFMSFVILIVCWFSAGMLLLLLDRESVSTCNLVWRDLVFLWCIEGEGCPFDLVIKCGGPITFDSRSGVSSLAQVWFWAFYGFFRWIGDREVVAAE